MKSSLRHSRIIELLRMSSREVDELANILDVSASTIRRDLSALQERGWVVRRYGGAQLTIPDEIPRKARGVAQAAEKDAIATVAASIVPERGLLWLGAGSTAARIASRLTPSKERTIITNGLETLLAIADAGHTQVLVVGGEFRTMSQAMVGPIAETAIERMSIDVMIVGADGLRPDRGISCPNPELARLKELKFRRAEQVLIVADHTKLGATPHSWWCPLTGPWTLITDERASEEQLTAFRREPHCEVIVAQVASAQDNGSTPEPL